MFVIPAKAGTQPNKNQLSGAKPQPLQPPLSTHCRHSQQHYCHGMRKAALVVVSTIALAFGIAAVSGVAFTSVDIRMIGRTDPKRAANYRLPWFNFSETYANGRALGIEIGSSKLEAIRAADRAGFVVRPSGWGDDRAGGADLYREISSSRDDASPESAELL
jgi:hypothetical protein